MRRFKSVQANRRLSSVWLAITGGLTMLLLAILLGASAGSTPTAASSAAVEKAAVLNNGSVITIGVAESLSGPAAEFGWRQANAVQLAVNQANAAGGVDIGGVSHTLALVTEDSACDPTQAITAANTLLDAGAVTVVGHTCSGASFAAQEVYNAAGVPMVSGSSSHPELTQQGYTTTFRTVAGGRAAPKLLGTYLRDSLALERAAVVELGGVGEDISEAFTSLGGTITSRREVASTAEYTAALTAIKSEDPDAIFYGNFDGEVAGTLSRVAHALGMTDVVMAWDNMDAGEGVLEPYTTAAGAAAEGDYTGINQRRTEDMPGFDAFNTDYQAAGFSNYGDEPGAPGAFAYDAANIVIAAMDRADSADPAAIRDAIAATADYDGVVGTYEGFDANGDVIPQWAWLARYQNGEWVRVYPFDVFLPLVLNDL